MRKKSLLKGAVAFCLASSLLAQPALAADYTALRQANGGALAEQHRFLPTTEKAVILTFGGLSKEAPLQHILSYMQRENLRGTFFVTEREAARNGSNIALIKSYGQELALGLTPLEGLVMGTRSGDLDPAILQYICNHEKIDINEMLRILNKESGVMALSNGLSSDFRDLEEAMDNGNKAAGLAIDAFCYRVAKYVGAYVAAMNGVDAITFTGGIGENAGIVRKKVLAHLGYLGITMDEEQNKKRGERFILSTKDSKVTVSVIPTNEELAICRETVALVNAQ